MTSNSMIVVAAQDPESLITMMCIPIVMITAVIPEALMDMMQRTAYKCDSVCDHGFDRTSGDLSGVRTWGNSFVRWLYRGN